jgi:hypothetical protein
MIGISLSNGTNRVDVSHPSPEDENRSNFRIVVFFGVLYNTERWTKSKNALIPVDEMLTYQGIYHSDSVATVTR